MPLAPGTRIGSYEIASLIGAGGMGEVFRARDLRLGRDVALKVLPDSVAHDPERRARFEREARALASLNHPNIAQIHEMTPGVRIEGGGGRRSATMPAASIVTVRRAVSPLARRSGGLSHASETVSDRA